jgi:hypothetical protein
MSSAREVPGATRDVLSSPKARPTSKRRLLVVQIGLRYGIHTLKKDQNPCSVVVCAQFVVLSSQARRTSLRAAVCRLCTQAPRVRTAIGYYDRPLCALVRRFSPPTSHFSARPLTLQRDLKWPLFRGSGRPNLVYKHSLVSGSDFLS